MKAIVVHKEDKDAKYLFGETGRELDEAITELKKAIARTWLCQIIIAQRNKCDAYLALHPRACVVINKANYVLRYTFYAMMVLYFVIYVSVAIVVFTDYLGNVITWKL